MSYQRLARAEFAKLTSLRSSAWTLGATAVASIGIGAAICAAMAAHADSMSASDLATWDPTNQSLVGTTFGQLGIAVFGVLAITSEYASGTIRASLAAVPRRTPMIVAKAAVYGGVAFLVGEVISFISFFLSQALFSGHLPTASIGDPGVLRSVVLAGFYLCAVCLISLGIGTLVRNTAAAITAVVAMLLVLPGILAALPQGIENAVGRFLPIEIAGGSMAAVVPEDHYFSALVGTVLVIGYALAALGGGLMVLRRRDV